MPAKTCSCSLEEEKALFPALICAVWGLLSVRHSGEEAVEVWFSPSPESEKERISFPFAADKTDSLRSLLERLQEKASLPEGKSLCSLGLVKPEQQVDSAYTLYDLVLHLDANGALRLQYDDALHEAWFPEQIIGHLRLLINRWTEEPDCGAFSFPLLTEAEHTQILVEWNSTEVPFPDNTTLYQLFEEKVEQNPDGIAVVCREESLTYRELNQKANSLARAIRAHYRALQGSEILPDTPIGLCMGRSVGMIVAMMGIFKAGCAYLPLDPDYPTDRLRFMMDDAVAPLIITEQSFLEKLLFLNELDYGVISLDGGWEFISRFPDTNLEPVSGPDNLAYIIYTSGSTGKPKGVMIGHRNAVNFSCNEIAVRDISFSSRILAFSSINFDAAVADICPALLGGAALHIIHDEIRKDPDALFEYCLNQRITGSVITPAVLHALPKQKLPEMTSMVIGGDVCDREDVRFWCQGRKLINGYGPTECTVCATELLFNENSLSNDIGRPIANVTAYILDSSMHPVPVGVAGELYIGGAGVGRGYLNRKELTAERFVNNPFTTPEERNHGRNLRIYRTGDRVRWMQSGSIEFLGRVDFQVKIRGFRIEPGEIEAVLAQHADIRECVVSAYDEGDEKRLAAYFVPVPGRSRALPELRSHLRQQLPDYMVPAVFIQLDKLPLSPSLKVDRHALPLPDAVNCLQDGERKEAYLAPRNQQEQEVARIICQIMNREQISIRDDLFDLGAHSLMAGRMAAELRKQFSTKIEIKAVFENPTIEKLAVCITNAGESSDEDARTIPRAVQRHFIPLTFQQEQIWFLSKLITNNRAYNAQVAVRLTGKLDQAILTRSIEEIICRHEILRTTFQESNYGPVQVVQAPWKVTIPLTDLTGLPEAEREAEANRLIEQEIGRAFDYTRLPLVKWVLYRLSDEHHLLLFMEHHFVHDGWEVSVFFNELKALYQAFSEQKPSPLEKLPIQYADYAIWQRRYLSGPRLEEKIGYWTSRIGEYPHILNLPQDRPRATSQSFNGSMIPLDLKGLYHRLREFSKTHKVTLFATMFSAYAILLAKYSRQQKFLVGTGVANRTQKETEGMLGMFVNTVLLCPDLSDNPTFSELIRTTREQMLQDSEHYDLPFKHIVERLKAGNAAGRNPIFQSLFAFHDSAVPYLDFAGLHGSLEIKHNSTAKTDLTVVCIPRAEQHSAFQEGNLEDEELSILWEYNSDLFNRETMQGMLDHYIMLLEQLIQHPDQRVLEVEPLLPHEREQVLYGFNDLVLEYDQDKTMQQLFREQVALHPDKVAIIHNNRTLSYQELNRLSDAAASRLRQQYLKKCGCGLPPETAVGLCCERSPEMVVGMLAILKAGGTYLPLPPSYPAERLRYIMEDAGVQFVFAHGRVDEALAVVAEEDRCLLPLDADKDVPQLEQEQTGSSADTAYIIYTSGSTGKPKGVCISHQAVHNYCCSVMKEVHTGADVLAQCASYAFDASIYEIWGALLTGGSLVIVDSNKIEDFDLLHAEVTQHGITSAFFTTALFNAIVDCKPELLARLNSVIFGGESANSACVRKLLATCPDTLKVVHAYGPTECTCYSTWCTLTSKDVEGERIPIGRPLHNYTTYLLDERMNPVPLGMPGELYIGGDSLASGYLKRPELTAERFVANPFATDQERGAGRNTRLYKTGDLMLQRNNGNLEFLGRVDFQVKIRGFRIEPEEIEAALLRHQEVKQCIVVPWEQNLAAYWVPEGLDATVTTEGLKSFLAASLPDFMVPAVFVKMESFPLNNNFKVDRNRLPAPKPEDISTAHKEYLPPATRTEEAVQEIWKELLKQDNISVEESFFEIGGNSIMTVRMLSAIKRKLGLEVNLSQMFALPTIRGIAARIDGTGITTGAVDDNLAQALRDARQTVELNWHLTEQSTGPGAVLLTGVTGFLGVYLLDALIAGTTSDIYCLIRDDGAVQQRLDETLSFYRKDYLRGHPRIHTLKGDLEAPGLGIEPAKLDWLKENLDSIWHCGALVHHMYDYGRLKKANVQSSIELLQLAATGRKKSYNYVSTLGAASIRDAEGNTVEVDVSDGPVSTNGYVLSKWVSEQILGRAADKGMQVNIFRPGNITGDSVHGICRPETNHTLLRIKGCLQMKAAPDWKRGTEMVPVDLLAQGMLKLSSVATGLNIYNMNNPREVPWQEYVALFSNSGYNLDLVPEDIWRDRHLAAITEKNALYPIKGFYAKQSKEAGHRDWKLFNGWNSSETVKQLHDLGIHYPDDYANYMKTVTAWLAESGFLSDLQE